jgi:hypothetical protein
MTVLLVFQAFLMLLSQFTSSIVSVTHIVRFAMTGIVFPIWPGRPNHDLAVKKKIVSIGIAPRSEHEIARNLS